MTDDYAEMIEYLYDHAATYAEFKFWQEFFVYTRNEFAEDERRANQPPLPETGKFDRGEVITPEDFDMLVDAVRHLQDTNL